MRIDADMAASARPTPECVAKHATLNPETLRPWERICTCLAPMTADDTMRTVGAPCLRCGGRIEHDALTDGASKYGPANWRAPVMNAADGPCLPRPPGYWRRLWRVRCLAVREHALWAMAVALVLFCLLLETVAHRQEASELQHRADWLEYRLDQCHNTPETD